MRRKKLSSLIPQKHWKKTRIISQITNGLISLILGITTFTLKRPKKYVIGGTYDPSYPSRVRNPIINWETSLFSIYFPAVAALIFNIANAVFLTKSRVNDEMKNWVKFLIILFNVAWILIILLIPQKILPAREFRIPFPDLYNTTWYGVFSRKIRKSR